MLATHAQREAEDAWRKRAHARGKQVERKKANPLSLCIAQSLEKTQRKRSMDGWGGEIQGT
jgi:hypothetical protein